MTSPEETGTPEANAPQGVWVTPVEMEWRESLHGLRSGELERLSADARLMLAEMVLRVCSAHDDVRIEVEHARARGKDDTYTPGVQRARKVRDAVRDMLRFTLFYGVNAPMHRTLPPWDLDEATRVADELVATGTRRRQEYRQQVRRELKEAARGRR